MKKLIEKFNTPNTILIVSGYPGKSRGGKERNHGMAWYTKKTAGWLAKEKGHRVVVLAENGTGSLVEQYCRGKVLVLRVFGKSKTGIYPQILKWLNRFGQVKRVYVHSEFGATGGVKHFLLLPLFLLLIRLTGRKIVYFAHNVIDDVAVIAPQFDMKISSSVRWVFNKGLKFYYSLVASLVEKLVVLEDTIGQRLRRMTKSNKVVVAPIPIRRKKKVTAFMARKRLELPKDALVIVYFGFVSWYKGADWLVKTFAQLAEKKQGRQVYLVMAGGRAYSLRDREHYQAFYSGVELMARQHPQIRLTGYVPEKEIATYMSAADAVVLPYRGLMGASGSLNQALAYRKPVVVSKAMEGVFGEGELATALENSGVTKRDIYFSLSKASFDRKLESFQNKRYLDKLKKFADEYVKLREGKGLLGREYAEVYGDEGKGYDVIESKGRRTYATVRPASG